MVVGGEHAEMGESERDIRPPASWEEIPFRGCGNRCENWDRPGKPASPPRGGNRNGLAAAAGNRWPVPFRKWSAYAPAAAFGR